MRNLHKKLLLSTSLGTVLIVGGLTTASINTEPGVSLNLSKTTLSEETINKIRSARDNKFDVLYLLILTTTRL